MIDIGGNGALAALISGTLLAFSAGWIAPDVRTALFVWTTLASYAMVSIGLRTLT